MKPLTMDAFEAEADLGNENRFQQVRIAEIKAFWASGAEVAELRTAGDITLSRERELYKKALRQLRLHREGVEFMQRKGKMFARRPKDEKHKSWWECPQCGGELTAVRNNGPFPVRHCLSCNFDFPVDVLGRVCRLE